MRVEKARFTVHIPVDVIAKARSAVYWSHGETLSDLVERALEAELARLEEERGSPFPAHGEPLKGGRPVRLRRDES